MKYRFFVFLFLINIFLQPLESSSQSEGKVKLKRYAFDSENLEGLLLMSQTIWYKGEQSIQEVPHLDMNTDSLGTHTKITIKYYLFIDAILRQFYYFNKFSCTAKMFKSYKERCPVEKWGGWDMYSNVPGFEYESSVRLSDTVILDTKYQRYFFEEQKNENVFHYILYSQKEKYNIPIRLFDFFSKKIESSIVRMDTYNNNQIVGVTQLEYIADTLTTDEDLLFKFWNKRLKLNKYK